MATSKAKTEAVKAEVKEEKKVAAAKAVKEKKNFKLTSGQRDIILILLVTVVLVIALVLTGEKKLDIELPIALEGTPGFNEITYSEYGNILLCNTSSTVALISIPVG